jgi:hypothetical protein
MEILAIEIYRFGKRPSARSRGRLRTEKQLVRDGFQASAVKRLQAQQTCPGNMVPQSQMSYGAYQTKRRIEEDRRGEAREKARDEDFSE